MNGQENDLGYTVMQLRNDVDDLAEAIEHLPDRLGGLDGSMEEVLRGLHQVEHRSLELESTSQELLAVVKRLGARVEWLERNIRLQSSTAEVELDDVDATAVELAQVAEAGHVARLRLLPPAGRSVLEAAVDSHSAAVRAEMHHRRLALAACEVLAETRWDDEEHREAAEDFRAALEGLAESGRRARELVAPALEAVDALAADEDRHRAVADVVADGEHAWTALQDRLRARVAEAVGEGALLPAWFTSVLGPIPPAQDTRAWMDVATSLLAYRVTYGISDPMVALGAAPGESQTARRHAWHQQLRRQLHDLQQ